MLLVIDMGNTHIEVGLMEGDELIMSSRISTDRKKTETEYAVLLHSIFQVHNIYPEKIEGAILSSVVPSLTYHLKEAVRLATGQTAMVVGPGVKTGLKIAIDDPKTLGADMVVDAVGGIALYGAPLILIDMGTATTISVVDESGTFRGGAIIPGVKLSLEALATGASQLPMIGLDAPGKVIGTNTVDCMKSGILYGQASLLDGMIDRMRKEMKDETVPVVATGGLSRLVIPYCRHSIVLNNELMLLGLKEIYNRNVNILR